MPLRSVGGEVFDAEVVTPREFADYSVIGLGSGIYFGAAHQSVRDLAKSLPGAANASKSKTAFLFSTSGLPYLVCVRNRTLLCERALRSHVANLVIPTFRRNSDSISPIFVIQAIAEAESSANCGPVCDLQ
jgi:hypothetical protein